MSIIVSLYSLAACKKGGDHSEIAEKFSDRFQMSCRATQGPWQTTAIAHTKGLISTLRDIKDLQDENCRGVTSALQAVQDVDYQLQRMVDNDEMLAYRLAQEKRIELLIALERLKDTSTPEQLEIIQTELYNNELEIARAKAKAKIAAKDDDDRAIVEGLAQLNAYTTELVSQGSLYACMQQNPFAPFQIGSSLLSIAGNFVSPTLGAALTTVGNMMGATLQYLSTLEIERARLNLHNVEMQQALTCSFEAMSNLYCDAGTAGRFVEFALENIEAKNKVTEIWSGMDILTEDLPVLLGWLGQVSNGIVPDDEHSANRQNEVWQKYFYYRTIFNVVLGIINKTKKLLATISDPTAREKREKSALKDIVIALYFPSGANRPKGPFAEDQVSYQRAVCILSDDNPNCENLVKANPNISSSTLIDQITIQGNFAVLENRTLDFMLDESDLITQELQDTIINDPEILVAEALENRPGQLSPMEVMEKLAKRFESFAKYLQNLGLGRSRAAKEATATAKMFSDSVKDIKDSSVPAINIVQSLFDKLQLLDGLSYVSKRVNDLIEWEINRRIENGEVTGEVAEDLIASSRSIVDMLEETGLKLEENKDEIIRDIRTGQSVAQQNLRHAVKFFAPTVEKALLAIKKTAREAGETSYEDPSLHQLAHFCIILLSSSLKWPEKVDKKICQNVVLHSAYKSSGLKLEFNKLYKKFFTGPKPLPFKKRVCTYYNFLRASRIFRRPVDPFSGNILFSDSYMSPFWFVPLKLTDGQLNHFLWK